LIVAIVQFGIIYKPLWNEFEKIKVQDTKLCSGTSQNLTTKKHMVWHYPFFLHCTFFLKWRFLLR